jgi:hypothetical protein
MRVKDPRRQPAKPPDGCYASSVHGILAAKVSMGVFLDRYWTVGGYASMDAIRRDDYAFGIRIRSHAWPWAAAL